MWFTSCLLKRLHWGFLYLGHILLIWCNSHEDSNRVDQCVVLQNNQMVQVPFNYDMTEGRRVTIHVCVCVCVSAELLQLCLTLWAYGLQPTRLLCPWDSPGNNTEVSCCALLQGIFLTQGSNPHLLWHISCIGRWVLTTSTTWEAQHSL